MSLQARISTLITSIGADIKALQNRSNASVRVYNSTDQTLSTGVQATIAFDTEEFDTNVIHDNSTNNSRLTCKTAGKYLVTGYVFWEATAGTGRRLVRIFKNGSNVIGGQSGVGNGTAQNYVDTVSCIIDLAVNDYVEMKAVQVAATTLKSLGLQGNTTFSMTWISQ